MKRLGPDLDLHRWRGRFEREGLTTTLRLELRDLLSPRVSLRAPFAWPFGEDEVEEETGSIRQLVEWEIVLSANHVHGDVRELAGHESWESALPTLLAEFTGLLRDALDLMRELGGADDTSDLSYVSQPSIGEHAQNSSFRDWTALIELNRDAWRAAAAVSPDRALRAAEAWSRLPYPLFRRLAFFAAAQHGIVPRSQGLGWLLADDQWWLWSVETQRETMRLLVALAPQLAGEELATLERAILAGPPRDMYRPDIEEERWTRIRESGVWLRPGQDQRERGGTACRCPGPARRDLRQVSGLAAGCERARRVSDLDGRRRRVARSPHSAARSGRTGRMAPARIPRRTIGGPTTGQSAAESTLPMPASALAALAAEGIWPTARWREALYQWSDDEQREHCWRELAPISGRCTDGDLARAFQRG